MLGIFAPVPPPISFDSHHTQSQPDEILNGPHVIVSLKENSSAGRYSWNVFVIVAPHKSEIMKHSPGVLPYREPNPDLCGKGLCCYPLGHSFAVSRIVPQQPVPNISCLKCHPADFLIPWSNAIHFLSLISIFIPYNKNHTQHTFY